MSNFNMNPGNHNQPPPSPRQPRGGNGGSSMHHTSAGFGSRRTKRNEDLEKKIRQMALPLAPLVQLTSGHTHPAFPSTLLNFWLLTSEQLDELATFYHQRWPCEFTRHYPCPITWCEDLSLEEKRRKIGKFIGLRGCDTPMHMRSEEQIMAAARQAQMKDDDDEALRRKASGFY